MQQNVGVGGTNVIAPFYIVNILHLFKEDQNLEYYEQSYDSK